MADLAKIKRKVTSAFKLSGFLICSSESTYIAEHFQQLDESEREKWLTLIIDSLQNQRLDTAHIDRNILEKAINDLTHTGLDESETVFSVIDAYSVPRFNYNQQNKKFEKDLFSRCIVAAPSMKSEYLRQRYSMLLQKTLRHELFAPAVIQNGISTESQVKKFKLQYAENLLATNAMNEVVILGLLTQLKEGKFFIEDMTGCVEIDLSGTRYHSGFFCEGCFVLAEGTYDDGILKVHGLGFPPVEAAASSRAFFGTQNSWGGESSKLLKYSKRLQEIEHENAEATFVFLSDIHLDQPAVRERLRSLFVGYDACPPIAIILMGPFSSTNQNFYELAAHFKELGALANGCDHLKKATDLILVPSCEDPTAAKILPRPPLPEFITADLRKQWPRVKSTTNPCRLQYCTQQIVVCRLDLMAKFCRNTLYFPTDTEHIEQHFSRTVVCQGHLAPIHPIACPIHWDYDAAMWLYPLPDLIVVGDACHPFTSTQHDCTVINPGSFLKSKFSFKVYIPATRTVEDSEIPNEMETESENH